MVTLAGEDWELVPKTKEIRYLYSIVKPIGPISVFIVGDYPNQPIHYDNEMDIVSHLM